jgi:hypothetical protein
MTDEEKAALLVGEHLAETEICKEIPVVEKYLNNILTGLQTQGGHPLKVMCLKFIINEVIPAANKMLNCPVPQQAS